MNKIKKAATIASALALVLAGNTYYALLRLCGRIRRRWTTTKDEPSEDNRYRRIPIVLPPRSVAPGGVTGHPDTGATPYVYGGYNLYQRSVWEWSGDNVPETLITSGNAPNIGAGVFAPATPITLRVSGYPGYPNEPWREYSHEPFPELQNYDTKPPSFGTAYNDNVEVVWDELSYKTTEIFTKTLPAATFSREDAGLAEERMNAHCMEWAQTNNRRLLSVTMSWYRHVTEDVWVLTATALYSKKFIRNTLNKGADESHG